ncbi:hypothetical protein Tsp_04076 [Trichinella spiralis]|uniref:hypothetical protein n=1 Tax=Trichinella spiralis TaxID=6334 RepID=UPI0001EFB349|nr:hypothetical protein Tsp_04076 [Trichinella spiralis]
MHMHMNVFHGTSRCNVKIACHLRHLQPSINATSLVKAVMQFLNPFSITTLCLSTITASTVCCFGLLYCRHCGANVVFRPMYRRASPTVVSTNSSSTISVLRYIMSSLKNRIPITTLLIRFIANVCKIKVRQDEHHPLLHVDIKCCLHFPVFTNQCAVSNLLDFHRDTPVRRNLVLCFHKDNDEAASPTVHTVNPIRPERHDSPDRAMFSSSHSDRAQISRSRSHKFSIVSMNLSSESRYFFVPPRPLNVFSGDWPVSENRASNSNAKYLHVSQRLGKRTPSSSWVDVEQ